MPMPQASVISVELDSGYLLISITDQVRTLQVVAMDRFRILYAEMSS